MNLTMLMVKDVKASSLLKRRCVGGQFGVRDIAIAARSNGKARWWRALLGCWQIKKLSDETCYNSFRLLNSPQARKFCGARTKS